MSKIDLGHLGEAMETLICHRMRVIFNHWLWLDTHHQAVAYKCVYLYAYVGGMVEVGSC